MSAATHATYFHFDTVEQGVIALEEQREKSRTLHRGEMEAWDEMTEAIHQHDFMRHASAQSRADERAIHHAIEQTVRQLAAEAVAIHQPIGTWRSQ